MVNDYSFLLLLLWQANIDIQFVSGLLLALAHSCYQGGNEQETRYLA